VRPCRNDFYVRLAGGGERVLETDRDRVVAEIVPPQPGRNLLLAHPLFAEAVREGWLKLPEITSQTLRSGGRP
jgi:antitoxin (DNA-binding transcriptional repressor) of toxin-antitoxin stability system